MGLLTEVDTAPPVRTAMRILGETIASLAV
jgi:hypothetical protein